jgi:hypothetical protein
MRETSRPAEAETMKRRAVEIRASLAGAERPAH